MRGISIFFPDSYSAQGACRAGLEGRLPDKGEGVTQPPVHPEPGKAGGPMWAEAMPENPPNDLCWHCYAKAQDQPDLCNVQPDNGTFPLPSPPPSPRLLCMCFFPSTHFFGTRGPNLPPPADCSCLPPDQAREGACQALRSAPRESPPYHCLPDPGGGVTFRKPVTTSHPKGGGG